MGTQQFTPNQLFGLDRRPIGDTSTSTRLFEADRGSKLAAVLFEQLGYLIKYSEQEHDRLEQVARILTAPFSESLSRYPPHGVR